MSDHPVRRSFPIDVISDIVCPWCYIGKRRLAAALARVAPGHPEVDFVVSWHPFQLNPDLPAEGVDRRDYLEAKFGGAERAGEIYARVRAAGRTAGIDFAFDAIDRQPNTLDAHRLITWAQRQADAEPLVERLFRAYFLDGRFVGDRAVLAAIAADAGFDAAAAGTMLASVAEVETVRRLDQHVRDLGVNSVPFFIFDNRRAVAGAEEAEALAGVIEEALATPETGE